MRPLLDSDLRYIRKHRRALVEHQRLPTEPIPLLERIALALFGPGLKHGGLDAGVGSGPKWIDGLVFDVDESGVGGGWVDLLADVKAQALLEAEAHQGLFLGLEAEGQLAGAGREKGNVLKLEHLPHDLGLFE